LGDHFVPANFFENEKTNVIFSVQLEIVNALAPAPAFVNWHSQKTTTNYYQTTNQNKTRQPNKTIAKTKPRPPNPTQPLFLI